MKRNVIQFAAAAALAFAGAAQADLVVDDFTVQLGANGFMGNTGVQTGLNGVNTWTVQGSNNSLNGSTGTNISKDNSAGCAHILGCYRNLFIENNFGTNGTASPDDVSMKVQKNVNTPNLDALGVPQDQLSFSINEGSVARATLTWNANGAGLNANFAGLTALQFWVKSDGGSGGTKLIEVSVTDGDGTIGTYLFPGEKTEDIPGNVDAFVLASLGFGEVPDGNGLFGWTFTGGSTSGMNWGDVDQLKAIINLNGDTDSLDFGLRAVTAVPEPGVLSLMGLALFGMGAIRRRS